MMQSSEFKKWDKVKVVKSHNQVDDEDLDTTSYIGSIGTIIEVDNGWKYPITIEFDDEAMESRSDKLGTLLWLPEQLIFWFDEPLPLKTNKPVEEVKKEVKKEVTKYDYLEMVTYLSSLQFIMETGRIDLALKSLKHKQKVLIEKIQGAE